MANDRSLVLPQFFPEDFSNGQAVYKLRTLVREVELARKADDTTEQESSSDWYIFEGIPNQQIGELGDFALSGTGDVKTIYYRGPNGWQPQVNVGQKKDQSTIKSIGGGTSLVASGNDIRSLRGEGSIKITQRDREVVISGLQIIDGGYFANRREATKIQVARGARTNVPLVGNRGEPFYAEDTRELFFGTGTDVEALRIRPENIIDFLDAGGTIQSRYLPNSTRPEVFSVAAESALQFLEAVEGDLAVVGESRGFVFTDQAWLPLSEKSDVSVSYDADVPIAKGALVCVRPNSKIAPADADTPGTLDTVAGIATRGGEGRIRVQFIGDIVRAGGTFTAGERVYAGAQGAITQTPPTTPLVIGTALTSTTVRLHRETYATNTGSGAALSLPKSGSSIPIKSLVADTGITLTENPDSIGVAVDPSIFDPLYTTDGRLVLGSDGALVKQGNI